MSPTVFRAGRYRFHFFSREEPRMHIHVQASDAWAKVWVEPRIELARSSGFRTRELVIIEKLIKDHEEQIRDAWNRHFDR